MSELKKKLARNLRLLPVLIIVASLAFIIRIGDAVITFKSMSGAASAETSNQASAVTSQDASAGAEGTQPSNAALKDPSKESVKEPVKELAKADGESTPGSSPEDVTLPSMDKDTSSPAWEDAKDIDADYSEIQDDMYKDLVDRRKLLDAREKSLMEREALLEAGQKELDRKYKELTGIRDEIQSLLKKQSEEEAARLQSLVKIYTGMKAKDAARIFNTLDMDILVEVVSKMPESKSAPILAAMDADRARAVTTLLAEQKKLPTLQ